MATHSSIQYCMENPMDREAWWAGQRSLVGSMGSQRPALPPVGCNQVVVANQVLFHTSSATI